MMVSVAVLELAARAVIPLPEVLNFERLAYARGTLLSSTSSSLAHATMWWWSEPDGATFEWQTNLYGFRGEEWTLRKPSGRRRVAFFGDSFVEGWGAPDGETIADHFSRLARERGFDLEALNLGAGGFGIRHYLPLIRDAVQLFHLDDVVLVLYMNDAYDIPEVGDTLAGELLPERSHRWRPRLTYLAEWLLEGRRVPFRWHGPHGSEPTGLAVEARYLDLTPALREAELAGRRLYWPYDSHMTPRGYSMAAQKIFQWWLPNKRSRASTMSRKHV